MSITVDKRQGQATTRATEKAGGFKEDAQRSQALRMSWCVKGEGRGLIPSREHCKRRARGWRQQDMIKAKNQRQTGWLERGAGKSGLRCGCRKGQRQVRQSNADYIDGLVLYPSITKGVGWSCQLRSAEGARTQDCKRRKFISPQRRASLGRIPKTIPECLPLTVKFLIRE